VATKESAKAALEESSKKRLLKILYAQDNVIERRDMWQEACMTFDSGLGASVVDLSSRTLFEFSRGISRYVLEHQPQFEDEALSIRFARPDTVLRGVVAVALQLSMMHLVLPLERTVHNDRQVLETLLLDAALFQERLQCGDICPSHELLDVYYQFILPALSGSSFKAGAPIMHSLTRLVASHLCHSILHHYLPIETDSDLLLVGSVVGAAVEGMAPQRIDSVVFLRQLRRLYEARTRQDESSDTTWVQHVDWMDCAARTMSREGPTLLQLSHDLRGPRTPSAVLVSVPTEHVEVTDADDVTKVVQSIRSKRHRVWFGPSSASQRPNQGLLLHVISTTKRRFVDNQLEEQLRADVSGVWSSEAVGKVVLENCRRIVPLLMKLFC
jgi:hypothetical protein